MRPTADVAGKLPTSPKPMSSAMIQTMLGFAALAETSIESKSARFHERREAKLGPKFAALIVTRIE